MGEPAALGTWPEPGALAVLRCGDREVDVRVRAVEVKAVTVVALGDGFLGVPATGEEHELEWSGEDGLLSLAVAVDGTSSDDDAWTVVPWSIVGRRREFFRAVTTAEVVVVIEGMERSATMTDLSETGVGLILGGGPCPEVEEVLEVVIDCEGRAVPCQAQVRWSSTTVSGRWRLGAQLQGLTTAEERLIRRRVLMAQTKHEL